MSDNPYQDIADGTYSNTASDNKDPYQSIADGTYNTAPAPIEAPKLGLSGNLADASRSLASGIPGVGGAIGYGLEKSGIAPETGRMLRESSVRATDAINAKQSPQWQEAAAQPLVNEDNTLNPNFGVRSLAANVLPSIPSTVVMGVAGGPIAKAATYGAEALGAGAKLAPIIGTGLGYGATEGVFSGAQNADQWGMEQRANAPRDTEGKVTAEAEANIQKGEHDILLDTAWKTGGLSAVTGGGVLGMLNRSHIPGTQAAKDGFLKATAKGIGSEALQEAPQSGFEQRTTNQATKDYIDPNQDLNEGVANATIVGGLAGGVMGGFGGLGHIGPLSKAAAKNPTATHQENDVNVDGDLNLGDAANVANVGEIVSNEPDNTNKQPSSTSRTENWKDELKAANAENKTRKDNPDTRTILVDGKEYTTHQFNVDQILHGNSTHSESKQAFDDLYNQQQEANNANADILNGQESTLGQSDSTLDSKGGVDEQEETQAKNQELKYTSSVLGSSDTGRLSGLDARGTGEISGGLPEQNQSPDGQDVLNNAGYGVEQLDSPLPKADKPQQDITYEAENADEETTNANAEKERLLAQQALEQSGAPQLPKGYEPYQAKIAKSSIKNDIDHSKLDDAKDIRGNPTGWKLFEVNGHVGIFNPKNKEVYSYATGNSGTEKQRAHIVMGNLAADMAINPFENLPQDELTAKKIYNDTKDYKDTTEAESAAQRAGETAPGTLATGEQAEVDIINPTATDAIDGTNPRGITGERPDEGQRITPAGVTDSSADIARGVTGSTITTDHQSENGGSINEIVPTPAPSAKQSQTTPERTDNQVQVPGDSQANTALAGGTDGQVQVQPQPGSLDNLNPSKSTELKHEVITEWPNAKAAKAALPAGGTHVVVANKDNKTYIHAPKKSKLGQSIEQENQTEAKNQVETPATEAGASRLKIGDAVTRIKSDDTTSHDGVINNIREYNDKQFISTDQSGGRYFSSDKVTISGKMNTPIAVDDRVTHKNRSGIVTKLKAHKTHGQVATVQLDGVEQPINKPIKEIIKDEVTQSQNNSASETSAPATDKVNAKQTPKNGTIPLDGKPDSGRDDASANLDKDGQAVSEAGEEVNGLVNVYRANGSQNIQYEGAVWKHDGKGGTVPGSVNKKQFKTQNEAEDFVKSEGVKNAPVYTGTRIGNVHHMETIDSNATISQNGRGEIKFRSSGNSYAKTFHSVVEFERQANDVYFNWPEVKDKYLSKLNDSLINYDDMEWGGLKSLASAAKLYKVGMNRDELIVALKNKQQTTPPTPLEASAPLVAAPFEPIEYNGYKIYQTTIKDKQYYAVQSKANKEKGSGYSFGDTLHDNLENAKLQIEQNLKNDAWDAERKQHKDAVDKKDADEKAERDDIDGFGENLSLMQKGKAIAALNKKIRIEGNRVLTTKELVKELVAKGEKTSSYEEDAIKPMTRRAFNNADQREQDAHEKRIKEGGKKTVYQVSGYELGKIAHDYANYLIDKQDQPIDSSDEASTQATDDADNSNNSELQLNKNQEKARRDIAAEKTVTLEAVHIEGDGIERVTPKVIDDSLDTAEDNYPLKTKTEMREWLVTKIDAAILSAQSNSEAEITKHLQREAERLANLHFLQKNITPTPKELAKEIDRNGGAYGNKEYLTEKFSYVTFDVPGDGKFKVINTKDHLSGFKKKVLASPGFRETSHKKPTSVPARPQNSAQTVVNEFIKDGELDNAYYAAQEAGITLGYIDSKENGVKLLSDVESVDILEGRPMIVGRLFDDKGKSNWGVTDVQTGLRVGASFFNSSKSAAISGAKESIKGIIDKVGIDETKKKLSEKKQGSTQAQLEEKFRAEQGITDQEQAEKPKSIANEKLANDKNRSNLGTNNNSDGEVNEQQKTYGISEGADSADDAGWRNSALQRPQVINAKTGTVKTGITQVGSPEDVLHIVSSFSDYAQEQMVAVVLDKNNKALQIVRHTAGLNDQSMVDPGILAGAIHSIKGAKSVYFAHNHPSGTTNQSSADANITDKLHNLMAGTGIEVKGMLVTVTGKYGSFYDSVHDVFSREIKETEVDRTKNIPVTERKLVSNTKLAAETINGSDDAIRIANIASQGRNGILLMDNQNQPVSFIEMTVNEMSELRTNKTGTGAALLLSEIHQTNARALIMVIPMPEKNSYEYVGQARNLSAFASGTGYTRMLDAIIGKVSLVADGQSISSQGSAYYSKSNSTTTNPHTEQSLLSAMRKAMDGKYYSGWFSAVLDTGKIKLVSREEAVQIGGEEASDAKGFYFPATDTSFIVFDNLSKDSTDKELQGLLNHEIAAHALRLGKTDAEFKKLLRQFAAMRKTNPAIKAAFARIPKDTKFRHILEEGLAYYLEENSSHSFAQKIIAAFRKALRAIGKTLPVLERAKWIRWANTLSEDDIISMSNDALRSAPTSLLIDGIRSNDEFYISKSSTKPVDPKKVKKIIELYNLGFGATEISKKISVSMSAVNSHLHKNGVRVRSNQEAHGVNKETVNNAVDLYRSGFSTYKVAKSLGVNNTSVMKWAKEAGVTIRSASENRGVSDEMRKNTVDFYNAGLTPREISKRVSISIPTIASILTKNGIKPRNASESASKRAEEGRGTVRGVKVIVKTRFGDIKADSTYEAARIVQLSKDDTVASMERYRGFIKYGNGRRYTPDFYIKMANGDRIVEEIKAEHKLQSDNVIEKAIATKDVLGDMVQYRIITESAIDFDVNFNDKEFAFQSNNDQLRFKAAVAMAKRAKLKAINDSVRLAKDDSTNWLAPNGDANDTLYSKTTATVGDTFTIPDETKLQHQQRLWQDENNRWTVLQDALKKVGGIVNGSNNVYKAMERMPHISAERIKDYNEEHIKPLYDRMAKSKATLNDLALLLYAQHAEERNREVGKINPRFQADNGSGMTNQEAKDAIDELKANYGNDFAEFESIAHEFQAITSETLAILESTGAVSKEAADKMKLTYQNYVPLKGFEVLDEEGNKTNGTGLGFSTGKSFGKRALGRESKAGQIIENIIRDHERAIVWQEKTNVAKTLGKLIEDNPDDKIWTKGVAQLNPTITKGKREYYLFYNGSFVGKAKDASDMRKFRDAEIARTGQNKKDYRINVIRGNDTVGSMPAPFDAEKEIRYLENGKEVRIQLHDELALRAFNKLGNNSVNGVFQTASTFNSFLREMWTQKNPAFFLINPIRDVQTASIVLTGEGGVKFAASAMKQWGSSWKTMMNHAMGKQSSPAEQAILERYRKSGGSVGTAYISSLEKINDDIHHALQRFGGESIQQLIKDGKIKEAAQSAAFRLLNNKVFDAIEHLNQAFEGVTRLATFKAAVNAGYSDHEAASLSSNVTVNFTKKGEYGGQLGAMYLFANAGIQGNTNVLKTLTQSDYKGQAWGIVGSLAILGFMAALTSGDDGDDDLVSDYEKQRNIVIKFGDKRLDIPLPYGWSFFSDIGRAMAQVTNGGDPELISKKLAATFMGNFSPIGNPIPSSRLSADDALVAFAPTFSKPFVMPAVNRGSFGTPLMPESPFKPNQPDSQKVYRKTRGTVYDTIATTLNSLTGGDKAQSGWIDVSPETIKNTVNYIAGGAGRFITDSLSAGETAFNPSESMKPETWPVVKSFYKSESIDDFRRRGFEQLNEIDKVAEQFSTYKKERDITGMSELKKESGSLLKLSKVADATRKQIKAIRDREDIVRNNGGDIGQIDSLENKERLILNRLNQMVAS